MITSSFSIVAADSELLFTPKYCALEDVGTYKAKTTRSIASYFSAAPPAQRVDSQDSALDVLEADGKGPPSAHAVKQTIRL